MRCFKNNTNQTIGISYTAKSGNKNVVQNYQIHPNEIFTFDETQANGQFITDLCVQLGLTQIV